MSVDDEVATKAGEFKGKYTVSVVDAIVAASAWVAGSSIISDESGFQENRGGPDADGKTVQSRVSGNEQEIRVRCFSAGAVTSFLYNGIKSRQNSGNEALPYTILLPSRSQTGLVRKFNPLA